MSLAGRAELNDAGWFTWRRDPDSYDLEEAWIDV